MRCDATVSLKRTNERIDVNPPPKFKETRAEWMDKMLIINLLQVFESVVKPPKYSEANAYLNVSST